MVINMIVRPRYFIETKDNLFFAVNGYCHPEDYIISFLRYIPDEDGDRQYNGKKYSKVNSREAYEYIKKFHPNYLFLWNVENKKMMGVPKEDIKQIHSPIKRLMEIRENREKSEFYEKVALLSDIFHKEAGIGFEDMGITGSTLAHLQIDDSSDIDFIVFGLENHRRARNLYGKLKDNPDSVLDRIDEDYWRKVYKKRIHDDSMSFDEFIWYESRKNNRGLIKGTLFDILSTMNMEDFEESNDLFYRQVGKMKIKCRILDDSQSFDTPAIYKIGNLEILEGKPANIERIVSYTHTYAGEVQENECVIASGVCEEVTDKRSNKKMYNLVVGTTRESVNEYIKLNKNPIK